MTCVWSMDAHPGRWCQPLRDTLAEMKGQKCLSRSPSILAPQPWQICLQPPQSIPNFFLVSADCQGPLFCASFLPGPKGQRLLDTPLSTGIHMWLSCGDTEPKEE